VVDQDTRENKVLASWRKLLAILVNSRVLLLVVVVTDALVTKKEEQEKQQGHPLAFEKALSLLSPSLHADTVSSGPRALARLSSYGLFA